MPLDLTKPVRTCKGKNRAIVINVSDDRVQWVEDVRPDAHFATDRWELDGNDLEYVHRDLENIPETKTFWVNCYPDLYDHCIHRSREFADAAALSHRESCIEVSYEIGQGL